MYVATFVVDYHDYLKWEQKMHHEQVQKYIHILI